MKKRTIERLMQLECFAYRRWLSSFSAVAYRLAKACNRAVKDRAEYRGVR